MSWLTDLFGGGEDEGVPGFQADPYYSKVQDYLFPYASNILEGNIPDYYKPIGDWGGSEYEKMLGLTTREITNSTNENLVRRGMSRSGVAADVIGKNVGDAATKLTWADYNRAMSGRQFLLGAGLDTMSGIRSGALTNQGQTNSYAMQKWQAEEAKRQQEDSMWSQLLSSGIGAIGNMYGMNMMGGGSTAPSSVMGGLGSITGSYQAPGKFGQNNDYLSGIWGPNYMM